MGIRDNFSQAVKELWKKDGEDKDGDISRGSAPTELDKYLQQRDNSSGNLHKVSGLQQKRDNVPLETPYYRPPGSYEAPVNNIPPADQNHDNLSDGINQNVQIIQKNRAQSAESKEAVYSDSVQPQPDNTDKQVQGGNSQTLDQNMETYGQSSYDRPQNQRDQNVYDSQDRYDQNQGGYNQNASYNRDFRGNYNGGNRVPPGSGNSMPAQSASNEVDEITVISKNTTIDGNIRSLANMQIDGNIKGNVETTRNVDMTGKIVGDITCNNAGMNSAAMQGNVSLKGRMKMDRDTILIGDLSSQYADINGRVRGKLDIVGKAELKRDAIVFGDINASTIAVTDGAIIQGYVNTTFLSKEDSRNVFPEAISIEGKEG